MDTTNLNRQWRDRLGKPAMIMMITLVIVSCALFKKKPAPPPEPARVVLEIQADGDINPNSMGLPSPLVLRIYQLKSAGEFQKADFLSLYHQDEGIVGKEIMGKQVVTLLPQEKRTIYIEPEAAVRAIGLVAGFREYQNSQWKAVTGVLANKFKKINVNITGNRLIVH